MENCRHCGPHRDINIDQLGHKRNCVCGHSHNEHVLFGPCKVKNCTCNGYDQRRIKKQEQDAANY